jgi:UDP-hydrolysing UDP-N-acetyl-D-glucosamine 2-epimerase
MSSDALRRVALLSGARSEYDILSPVARALLARADCAPAMILAAGNLSPFHGRFAGTSDDGLPVRGRIESLLSSDTWQGRALSFANLVEGLTRHLAADKPDLLMIAGDREEALAGAVVGNLLQVPVAHLHGGDRCLASDVDEVLRPAISKLAHLHFTATDGHRQRLIAMGELPERIWATGAPGLDRFRDTTLVPDEVIATRHGIDVRRPFYIVIYHPSPTLDVDGRAEIAAILEGIAATGHQVLCSYPNTDPGNLAIRGEIDRWSQRGQVRPFTVIDSADFVTLYRRCAAVIGNSSSIVVESGFLRVPGILVGRRQDLRETGPNVMRVAADAAAVTNACRRALDDEDFRRRVAEAPSVYGDGHAAERIASVIATVPLTSDLLRKTMPY